MLAKKLRGISIDCLTNLSSAFFSICAFILDLKSSRTIYGSEAVRYTFNLQFSAIHSVRVLKYDFFLNVIFNRAFC